MINYLIKELINKHYSTSHSLMYDLVALCYNAYAVARVGIVTTRRHDKVE